MAKKLYGRVLPRLCPKGKVIDYLNGDPHDERTSNKRFVTPEEAQKRIRIRQILRRNGRDPRALTLATLEEIYRRYTFASEEEAPRPPVGGGMKESPRPPKGGGMKDERTKERRKEKMHILSFVRCTDDRNFILVKTTNSSIFAREHFKAKGWFGTRDGRLLHLTKIFGLREVKACDHKTTLERHGYYSKNGVPGSARSYLHTPYRLRIICNVGFLHGFIWECYHGARTPGMQIDHINGIEKDNRLENLQEVTPKENYYRAVVLNAMRNARDEKGRPLWNMSYYEQMPQALLPVFDQYRHLLGVGSKKQVLKKTINPSYNYRTRSHGKVLRE